MAPGHLPGVWQKIADCSPWLWRQMADLVLNHTILWTTLILPKLRHSSYKRLPYDPGSMMVWRKESMMLIEGLRVFRCTRHLMAPDG
jgi:hypothetical protein